MEVMTMPNKETLQFTREVVQWIERETRKNGVLLFEFKKNTPQRVIDLFEKIKFNLPFN